MKSVYGVLVVCVAAGSAVAATPTSVSSRVMTTDRGGFVCGGAHTTPLDHAGRVLVQGPDDALAAALQSHFDRPDLVRTSVGSARGGGFDVQYLMDPDVAADAEFVAGLELAAGVWESAMTDPVTIVVEVGFISNVFYIGATSSNRFDVSYAEFRAAAVADAGDAESPLVSALPDPALPLEGNSGSGSSDDPFFDGIEVTTANARALGIPVDTSGPGFSDASIVFNTDFDFDSDPSDGITEGSIDTVYVMVHEIGHMLGFISSVDSFSSGDYATALDTYRVGINGVFNDPADINDFSAVAREVRTGVEAALDPVGAVVGAPAGEVYRFSTGTSGDGRQASHWKDDNLLNITPNIGVMDPTNSAPGGPGAGANPGYITYADRLAFSLIGWDIDLGAVGCSGDLDGDGSVGGNDLAALLAAWGTAGAADLNNDGDVNASDLAILLAQWGPCL